MLVLNGSIPSLDGTRAVAVMLVFLSHAGLSHIIPGGLGVTIFFFLSGYLITTLLVLEQQSTGNISLRKFFIRRIYRLFPPLYIVLCITLALCLTGVFQTKLSFSGVLSQFLQFTNYQLVFFGKQGLLPGLVVLWSLAVEEHFYIIYALAFYLMMSKSTLNRLGAGLIILCVVILFWRAYIAMGLVEGLNLTREFLHTSTASDTRVDSMIFGCIMAIFLNPLDSKKSNISNVNMYLLLTCSCAGILLTLLYRDSFFRETIRYTIQGIALIPFFYFSISRSNNILFKWLGFKWIEYFGKISYTFYLSHFVCIYLAPKILPTVGLIEGYVFAFVLSVAFSSLMYFTIETYFNKKRKQLSF